MPSKNRAPRSAKVSESIVAKLVLEEDGSLSNKRVERYALLRAEEVVTTNAAWTIIMSSERGNLPSGQYQALIHRSPAFRHRLEALMTERTELEEKGPWGQVEWQARQVYRRAAALDDIRHQMAATELLAKLLFRTEKPAKPDAESDEVETKGRGAPPAEAPVENEVPNARRERLLNR